MKIKILLLVIAVLFLGFYSCEELQDPPIDKNHVSLFIRLTDLPSEVEEVNIDLLVVGVIVNDTLHSLFTNAGIYNLLDYAGDTDTIIGSKRIPVGYLSQIRLVLGNNNTIKVNGEYHDLKPPSASESGLKLNVQKDLEYGITYTYLLDFDAEKSIVQAGEKYLLKPVINVISQTVADTTALK